jgi:hypothetical protein
MNFSREIVTRLHVATYFGHVEKLVLTAVENTKVRALNGVT